jgi:hypothetical protein
VVTQEIRALPQRSANASKNIKALISESNGQVKTGAQLVNQTGVALEEIVAAIKKASDIVGEIAAASRLIPPSAAWMKCPSATGHWWRKEIVHPTPVRSI